MLDILGLPLCLYSLSYRTALELGERSSAWLPTFWRVPDLSVGIWMVQLRGRCPALFTQCAVLSLTPVVVTDGNFGQKHSGTVRMGCRQISGHDGAQFPTSTSASVMLMIFLGAST